MESTEIIELPALQASSSYTPATTVSDDLASQQQPEVSTALPTQGENQIPLNQLRHFLSGCKKRLVPAASLLGVIMAVLAIWLSIEALEYVKWTAHKDYLEFCSSEATKQLSPSCSMIGNYTLPPPPHSFGAHHAISERSSVSHKHYGTSLFRGLDRVQRDLLFSSSSPTSTREFLSWSLRFFSAERERIAAPALTSNILIALLFLAKRERSRRCSHLEVTPLFRYTVSEGKTMSDDDFMSDDDPYWMKQQRLSRREHLDEPTWFFALYRFRNLWFDSLRLSWFETVAYLLVDALVTVLVYAMSKLMWLKPELGSYDPIWATLTPIPVILCDHLFTFLDLIEGQLPKRGPYSKFRHGDQGISRFFRKLILYVIYGVYATLITIMVLRITFLGLIHELHQLYSGK
ncbi:hypothetical protein BJX76DRAFT_93713 [Aspergillus varians]